MCYLATRLLFCGGCGRNLSQTFNVTTKSGLYYDLIQRKDGATGVEKVSGVKRPKLDVGR